MTKTITCDFFSAAIAETVRNNPSIILASMGETLHHPPAMPRTPFRVLFVCLGNICRSPAGENILRHVLRDAGLEDTVKIDSAGTHDYNIGNPPDHRMARSVRKRGIESTGKARQFTAHDFSNFDLILVMDSENLDRKSVV